LQSSSERCTAGWAGCSSSSFTWLQEQLIDPAVKGTLNVLASCARAQTKKVVLTSSVAAVAYTPKRTAGSFVDESWWTDVDYCEENKVFFWICQPELLNGLEY
jgi:nucleoside-diphosphate-sugar epimerase